MTEPSTVSLDEIRQRFVEAEARLGDAAKAIRVIDDAAMRVGAARESLTSAGDEIRGLAGKFGDVAAALTENAEELRRGVDAIRLGDPAAVRRQIEELDASFTAMQSVMAQRFGGIEDAQTALAATLETVGSRQEASAKAVRMEARVISMVTVLLIALAVVLLLVR